MVRWRVREILSGVPWAVALGVAAGCGGQSVKTTGDSDSEGGSGGTATTGGTGGVAGTFDTGGSVSVGGTGSTGGQCVWGGRVYEDGAGFPQGDGCNTCFCSAGEISCTLIDCPTDVCSVLAREYQKNLDIAKRCDAAAGEQCLGLVASAPQCGCITSVRAAIRADALEQIAYLWNERRCGGDVTCGACPPTPISGYCSSSGFCMDSFRE